VQGKSDNAPGAESGKSTVVAEKKGKSRLMVVFRLLFHAARKKLQSNRASGTPPQRKSQAGQPLRTGLRSR